MKLNKMEIEANLRRSEEPKWNERTATERNWW